MKQPELVNSAVLQLEAWKNVVHTEDWRIFVKMMEAHKAYLQKQVNEKLRAYEDRKAGEALRAFDDCQRIIDLVQASIDTLQKKINNDIVQGVSDGRRK